jgi:hypothetical protein
MLAFYADNFGLIDLGRPVAVEYVSEWETGKRGVSRAYAIRIEGVRS